MKHLLVTLTLMLSVDAFSHGGGIEEEFFVMGHDIELIQLLGQQSKLSIDHISEEGFEVYGPQGTEKYLTELNANFYSTKMDKNNLDFDNYPSYSTITQKLQELAAKFPKIARLESIGRSVQNRDLWVMKISDNVEMDEVEPEFKFISSMHGDEITGRELTLKLIDDILTSYGKDPKITALVNNTELFIMPSMNPDGSEMRRRANANGVDLNRDFPEFVRNDQNTPQGRQPETQAVMNFQKTRNFSLSANFHGGAVCVNYPWDARYDQHPFESLVVEFSQAYADLNAPMRSSSQFRGGITNGAQWYVLRGGMQDWSYLWHNDLQVTVELSNSKWPNYAQIPQFYTDNKESMLKYMELVHQGGGVKLGDKKAEGRVTIFKGSQNLGSYGFQNGEFYKVLDPGQYVFQVETKINGRAINKRVDVSVIKDFVESNGNFVSL